MCIRDSYKTTVKEFHKDKNGNLKELTIVSLESKKDEKTGKMCIRDRHETVENALKIVENLKHRAGKDADGKTGDGVGIRCV